MSKKKRGVISNRVFCFIVIILLCSSIISTYKIGAEYRRISNQCANIQSDIFQLKRNNEQLKYINGLKNSDEFYEMLARKTLNYSYPDEYVYVRVY